MCVEELLCSWRVPFARAVSHFVCANNVRVTETSSYQYVLYADTQRNDCVISSCVTSSRHAVCSGLQHLSRSNAHLCRKTRLLQYIQSFSCCHRLLSTDAHSIQRNKFLWQRILRRIVRARSCYRLSVCLSICQTRALWQNEIIACQYINTIRWCSRQLTFNL